MTASALRIAIIVGSTRPGSEGRAGGQWAFEMARNRGDAMFHLLEIADFNLCLLDEPIPARALNPDQPLVDQYTREHTRAWSEVVASFDGYVFVAPEYNRGISGALKNISSFSFANGETGWPPFIGYGATNGARAIEGLRLVMSAVQVGTVRPAVGLSLFTDFENGTAFRPAATQEQSVSALLQHVVAWSGAVRPLRSAQTGRAAQQASRSRQRSKAGRTPERSKRPGMPATAGSGRRSSPDD
jgi:NAD(P)H-dependent FMN reductase